MLKGSNFDTDSLAINKLFMKIKTELVSTDLKSLRLAPEGRRVLETMKNLEKLLSQDYNYAVKKAHEPQNSEEVEKEIANIYNTREKLIFTEHQIQKSRKKIGRILTWKERVEFGEVLKKCKYTYFTPI